jgi:hypothetical protein
LKFIHKVRNHNRKANFNLRFYHFFVLEYITELLLKVALNNINQNKPIVGRMHGDIYGYGSNLMSVRPSDGDIKIICTNLTPCNEEDSVLLSSTPWRHLTLR